MSLKNGRAVFLAAVTACAMVLGGCAPDTSDTSSETSKVGSSGAGSQNAAGEAGGQGDTVTSAGGGQGDTVTSAGGGQGDTVTSVENAPDALTDGTVQQPDDSSGEPVGEVIPDEWAEASDAGWEAEDVWSGRYVSESESVTVTLLDEETISFSFAQSGISGNAGIDGNQAVFHGDDYHVVVFSLNDTVLNIAVSSEEDFDASDSPLNGTFIRSAD